MLGLLEMEIALIVVFSITVTFKDIVCDSKMCPIKRIAPPRSPLAVRSVYTVLTLKIRNTKLGPSHTLFHLRFTLNY